LSDIQCFQYRRCHGKQKRRNERTAVERYLI